MVVKVWKKLEKNGWGSGVCSEKENSCVFYIRNKSNRWRAIYCCTMMCAEESTVKRI